MSFVCLWVPGWPTDAAPSSVPGDRRTLGDNNTGLAAALLTITPHVVIEARGVIWVDARGCDAPDVARRTLEFGRRHTPNCRASAASTPVAAEIAALHGPSPLVTLPAGTDAAFLAPFPLAVLAPAPRLGTALHDVGLATCGDLARLTADAVEVRFGAEGLALWRLARADDQRRIFTPAPRALPTASLAWEEYVLQDPEQLVFVANRLVAAVCAELRAWGETTRALTLELILADRSEIVRQLRTARDTASRTVWMRLIRLELDRLRLPGGIVGLSVRAEATAAAGARQGDIFDRGFSTARAVDDVLTQLGDDGTATLVEPAPSAHPLPERRMRWRARESGTAPATSVRAPDRWANAPRLQLQLFPEPRPVTVVTTDSRTHLAPTRFCTSEGHATALLTALGPDCISAGAETGAPYAREYFTCLTENGLLVLLYRDALAGRWYLHGWWD